MGTVKMKKILVVDDDPSIIKLLETVLKANGFEVVVANDGIDAMVQAKNAKPDLILLDVMMPELNGYEVCSHLKFDPQFKNIPIIILTSRDQELDDRIGKLMGIEYMHKPIDRERLLATIAGLIK